MNGEASFWKALTVVAVVGASAGGCGYPALKTYPRSEHFENFLTLAAGQPAPDFQLRDIDGAPWRLSDNKGTVIVLQFGSATSPGFVGSLNDFQREILSRYLLNPEVLFVYVFTTEAHPELLASHERQQMKDDEYEHRLAVARRYYYTLKFKDNDSFDVSGVVPVATNTVVLVDTVGGTVGATYGYGRGGTTNPAFLIDRKGILLAKALNTAHFLSTTGFLAGNLPLKIQSQIE